MSKIYLVKIKFTDYFFFGQGIESRGPLGNSANYFLHSGLFPQQTGVRGFLRYVLLQMNDILFPGEIPLEKTVLDKIMGLIGKDSQQIGGNKGRLQKISPLFVFQEDEPLIYRPNEFVAHCEKLFHPVSLQPNQGEVFTFLQKSGKFMGSKACLMDGYDAKKGFAEGFTNRSGKFIPLNSIFKTHLISGNRGNKDGTPDDESFYKQEFRALEKSYSFGCWIEMDDSDMEDIHLPLDNSTMFSVMGKEQKEVHIHFSEVEQIPDFQRFLPEYDPEGTKILLLSDALIKEGFEKECLFAVNQFIPFRYIHSSVENTKDYATLNQNRISKKTFLLKRGSVLYLKGKNIKFLNDNDFKDIGYNYYTQLKNN